MNNIEKINELNEVITNQNTQYNELNMNYVMMKLVHYSIDILLDWKQ